MAEPTFTAKYGVYCFSWLVPAHFSITLDRIRDGHDSLSAEFTLRNGSDIPIFISRFNLFSSVTRKSIASDLDSMLKINDFDWRKTIEYITQRTILAHRTGHEMIQIGKIPAQTGPRWRLKPLVPEGDVSVLFGPGGSGKSMLALFIGICVQHGWAFDRFIPERGNVAYLDWEWGAYEHNQRLKALQAGLELDFTPEIYYQYMHRSIEDEIDTIRPRLLERNVKLVIVDSKVPALGGAKEARENSEPLFRCLRSLDGVSCLVIDHITKDQEGKTRSPYGDVFGTWRPRHVVELRSVLDHEDEINIGLYRYKSNLAPAMLRGQFPFGLTIKESELGTTIEPLEIGGVPELAERMTIKQRVYDLLKSGALTKTEIANTLSVKPDSVKQVLWRFKGKLFVNLDPHLKEPRWGLCVTDGVTDGS